MCGGHLNNRGSWRKVFGSWSESLDAVGSCWAHWSNGVVYFIIM